MTPRVLGDLEFAGAHNEIVGGQALLYGVFGGAIGAGGAAGGTRGLAGAGRTDVP